LYNLAKQNIDDAESGRNIITMAEFDQGSWKLKLYNVRVRPSASEPCSSSRLPCLRRAACRAACCWLLCLTLDASRCSSFSLLMPCHDLLRCVTPVQLTSNFWYHALMNCVVVVHICIAFRMSNSNAQLRDRDWPITATLIIEREPVLTERCFPAESQSARCVCLTAVMQLSQRFCPIEHHVLYWLPAALCLAMEAVFLILRIICAGHNVVEDPEVGCLHRMH
jgi:hypothetical protein